MTSQSNQALLVECQPRRLGSVPGCSAGAGRIRFVRTAGESTIDSLRHVRQSRPLDNHCLQWLSIVPRSQLPGIADFEGSSPGIVSYAQRWGPNRSRSPLSYLRNMRSRGPLSFSQSTGGVLMRRTLVGLIAALALGSVSPAAFAADIATAGAGGELDRLLSRRRWRRRLGRSRHQSAGTASSTRMGSAMSDLDFHRDFNESSDGNIIGIVQGGFDWELAGSAFVVGLGADCDLRRRSHSRSQ